MPRRYLFLLLGLIALATSITTSSASAATITKTQHIVVRPVHANGTPVTGYTVTPEHFGGNYTCTEPSESAVDPNIDFCGFTATYTPSCWRSTNHTVLCLRNARVKALIRAPYDGAFARTTPVAHPAPQTLVLVGGSVCSIRIGGAWSVLPSHPTWVGYYSCTNGALYGPPTSSTTSGIDKSHPIWTVHYIPNGSSTPVTKQVAASYLVGTAA